MNMELDHLFVCTAPGAPEAKQLIQFGLREGPPNQHPGQGTANRRFALANAMLELLWVSNPPEAQSEATQRTLLWERWSARNSACPFGICLRPAGPPNTVPPFPSWEYRPAYLPDSLAMHIGEASIDEPMWVYLGFMQRAHREQHFVDHPNGIRAITGLTLTTPAPLQSTASRTVIESGVLRAHSGEAALLEIEFDSGSRHQRVDFRPHLPFVFHL